MTTARKPRKTAEYRIAEVALLRERLAAFSGQVDEAAIAQITAMYSGYSPRNAMLIAMQCPTATDVCGYTDWQKRGRQVRKGERGIQIMAPAGQYGDKPEQTGETAPKGDAETGDAPRMRFRVAAVFDVSQTDPKVEAATAA